MSLWGALLFLMLLGALIAYAGDVIGRRVGRRHVRLFGLRPRTTGLLVAVLSGMLIAVLVFAAFLLLARDARETILEAETVRQERNALLKEKAALLHEQARLKEAVENLKAQAARALAREEDLRVREQALRTQLAQAERRLNEREERLQALNRALAAKEGALAERTKELEAREAELAELKRQAAVAEAELRRLRQTSATLQAEVENLKEARAEAEARANRAIETLAELRAEQERLSAEVFKLQSEAQRYQGDVAELSALKVELEEKNRVLEAENRRLIRALDEARLSSAKLRGQLGELSKGNHALESALNALVRGKLLAAVEKAEDELPGHALNRALAAARAQAELLGYPRLATPKVSTRGWYGAGRIFVRALSLDEHGRLRVEVRFVPHRLLFPAGAVIVAAEVPRDERQALAALRRLRAQAEERLLALGVPSFVLGRGGLADDELAQIAHELAKGGSGRIAVVAAGPIDAAGPVRLTLRRLP